MAGQSTPHTFGDVLKGKKTSPTSDATRLQGLAGRADWPHLPRLLLRTIYLLSPPFYSLPSAVALGTQKGSPTRFVCFCSFVCLFVFAGCPDSPCNFEGLLSKSRW